MNVFVDSSNVKYNESYIEATYSYHSTKVEKRGSRIVAIPHTEQLQIQTQKKVPKLGLMLIGWGGNNGSTMTAALIANKLELSWQTKNGIQHANWFGSVTQSSTIKLGSGSNGEDVYVPLNSLVPMINPNDIILDGWDISSANLYESMERARVLEPTLQQQLKQYMTKLKPKPSVYNPDFIAANQASRADNLIMGTKMDQVQKICKDIKNFKESSGVDKVILLWTANTERCSDVIEGVNDTESNLKNAIARNHPEISPSTLFAYASILMKCPYINGSPQNTFVPGIVEMAEKNGIFIAGDDFKSGQTKLKSVLVDFLVNAGIKPVSVVSYNHLGNNDGKNLSAPQQFRSKENKVGFIVSLLHLPFPDYKWCSSYGKYMIKVKRDICIWELVDVTMTTPVYGSTLSVFMLKAVTRKSTQISKSSVIDDMVQSNSILYQPGEKPDHVVVIKYVPYVGDSKRAMDEYTSEIMMGGLNTLVVHNTCEDSLLATPIILDLIVLAELCARIQFKRKEDSAYSSFHPVLSILSYLCKAPLVPKGTPVVNALSRQRACIENVLRACIGLQPDSNMTLEHKVPFLMEEYISEPSSKKRKIENGNHH